MDGFTNARSSQAIRRRVGWMDRVRQWLVRRLDRRRAGRRALPLTAFYWEGTAPKPHVVRDISMRGAYIATNTPWYYGTIVNMTFQRQPDPERNGHETVEAMCVPAGIVRVDPEGIGVQFLYESDEQRRSFEQFLKKLAAGGRAKEGPLGPEQGQSLVEFALILPLLVLLIVNVVNFGALFYAWITVSNAARSGAQYMVMGGATINGPSPPSAAQVAAVVTNNATGLLNRSSLLVKVCTNNGGGITCVGSGGPAPPIDPEPLTSAPVSYVLGTVDVTYTYQPLIPIWDFPGLGIHATLPTSTVHQRAAMRMLQ